MEKNTKISKTKKIKDHRTMPHSIESEQCVLGCAIIDNDAAFSIMSELKESDFYAETHKLIFEAMYKLYCENKHIDLVTVDAALQKSGNIDSVGGIEYLTSLVDLVPSISVYKHYVDIVKNNSVLRQLIATSNEIADLSYEDVDREQVLSFAEEKIFKIGEKDDRGGLTHINLAVNNALSNFEAIQSNQGVIRGVPTGIYALDKLTNGFQKGALILIAARPGCGKTSLGMNIVNHAAVKAGKKCAIFSLEMSKEEIASRSICSMAYVDMGHALKGEMNPKEWAAVVAASKKLKEANIYIDEGFSKSPMDILSKCRKLKREKGLDLLMIDYLQLMQASSLKASDNRTNEVSQITRDLKMAARELEIPIILLSQLSRQSEGRKDHRPILSDLRESGSIEQDADMVLFIYRPDQYRDVSEEERNSGLAEIIVAKNRSGESPTIKVKWVGSITSFLNLEKDADAQSLEATEPVTREQQTVKKEDNATAVIAPDEEEIPLPDAPPASSNESAPVVEEPVMDSIEEEPMIIKPMEGGDELLDIWDD